MGHLERTICSVASFGESSIPVRVFLESGVYFPLVDSVLVWSHPGLFEPVELERPVSVAKPARRPAS